MIIIIYTRYLIVIVYIKYSIIIIRYSISKWIYYYIYSITILLLILYNKSILYNEKDFSNMTINNIYYLNILILYKKLTFQDYIYIYQHLEIS